MDFVGNMHTYLTEKNQSIIFINALIPLTFFDKTKTIINIIKLKLYSLSTLIYYNSPF